MGKEEIRFLPVFKQKSLIELKSAVETTDITDHTDFQSVIKVKAFTLGVKFKGKMNFHKLLYP
jgi:hypothetical protein